MVLRWRCCFFCLQLQAFALSTFDLHFGGTGTLQMQDTLPNGPFAIEEGVQYPNLLRDGQVNDQRSMELSFFLSKLLKRIPTGVKAWKFKKGPDNNAPPLAAGYWRSKTRCQGAM